MKKLLTTFIISISCMLLLAQVPQKFSYQAVVRDGSGNVISNQNVSFRISIVRTVPEGTIVYEETHTATSNQFGLTNLSIGAGTVISGNFSSIDWGGDTYFIKVEVDVNGGSSYILISTTQLLSVPYAQHAVTADSLRNSFFLEIEE